METTIAQYKTHWHQDLEPQILEQFVAPHGAKMWMFMHNCRSTEVRSHIEVEGARVKKECAKECTEKNALVNEAAGLCIIANKG